MLGAGSINIVRLPIAVLVPSLILKLVYVLIAVALSGEFTKLVVTLMGRWMGIVRVGLFPVTVLPL